MPTSVARRLSCHLRRQLHNSRRANIADLENMPGFAEVRHDIVEPLACEADIVCNLACPASPVKYQADPVQTMRTSVWGMYHLLEVARKSGARLFQASTSEVYGDPTQHPQTEGYHGNVNPIGIRACYDEGKRAAEALCFDYARQHQVDVRVGRIFNTYGPAMDPGDGRVVSNFLMQALRNEPITIYGDGMQTRSFCYVDDLIDVIVAMLEGPFWMGPVNVGNPSEITVAELATEVIRATESLSEINFLPLPKGDPAQRRPDITRACRLYGWQPRISLQQGIRRCIPYFGQGIAIKSESGHPTEPGYSGVHT